jgi:hypothetical protein
MTLEQKIIEAEDALHELSLGRSVVTVTRDGKSLTYNAANRVDLERYLANLKSQLGTYSRRPMSIRL